LDSANSFVLTPRFSLQTNTNDASTFGSNAFRSGLLDSRTDNLNTSDRAGYTFNNGLLWRHRFNNKRRSFSAQFDMEANDRDGERLYYSRNIFDLLSDTTILDRRTDELTKGYRVGGRITYTEPLGEKSQLQLNYAPSYTDGLTDRIANALDPDLGTYTVLDTSLSNRFASTYLSQRGGASVRFNKEKWSYNFGLDAQYATLTGDREFPLAFGVDRTFTNLLPNAMFNWKPVKGTSLRLFYRTSTREPSIDQLQDVVDISNPLFLRSGNTQLVQSYTHNMTARYGRTVAEKGSSLFLLLSAGLTDSYIGTSSTVATGSPVEVAGILIPAGGQLSRPVNLDGAWNGRSFITYGLPVKALKSNLNINGGYTFNQLPALINDQRNLANNHTWSQGAMLSSNISERIDFALGYTANWSMVRNSLQQNADNDYLSTTGTFRLQWNTPQNVVVRTNMNYTRFDGLAEGIDAGYLLWNASIGYKLLKDRSLEVALNLFDLLNENNSIARSVTETWIEDSRTNVLGRYAMLTVTWNMRYFKKMSNDGEGG
jgi:outer membrane receptor protein involved in Fe transport